VWAAVLARSNRLEDWTKTGSTVAAFFLGQGRTREHPRVVYRNSNTAAERGMTAVGWERPCFSRGKRFILKGGLYRLRKKLTSLKGTACLAAASLRPYITAL
jgi:hypothetical protein